MSSHHHSLRAPPMVLRAPGIEKPISQEKHSFLQQHKRFVVRETRTVRSAIHARTLTHRA